jgi:DNA polymerase II small subunit/DNA polymerase delta subunit B
VHDYWNRLHGHASEAECARGHWSRCEPGLTLPLCYLVNSTKHSIPAPPPPDKIHSSDDRVMVEDESGRIRLIGKMVDNTLLVTGVIVGVLGAETSSGDFEVVDLCFPGMAPQTNEDERMDVDGTCGGSEQTDEISIDNLSWTHPGRLQVLMMVRKTNT